MKDISYNAPVKYVIYCKTESKDEQQRNIGSIKTEAQAGSIRTVYRNLKPADLQFIKKRKAERLPVFELYFVLAFYV